jgi:glycosyltransferase involved in cell wall biosynthesis
MAYRALVIHALFDILGGGELFALKLSQALIESEFEVELLTATPVDTVKLRDIYGDVEPPRITVKRVREAEYLSKLMPGRLVRLKRLAVYREYESLMETARREYDIVFDTQSNLPTPVDISYIHFPAVLELTGVERRGVPWAVYNQLIKYLAGRFKTPRSGRVLTNSTWTAHMVYTAHHVYPDILYPPVDIEYFNIVSQNDNREKLVVTISRFTREKKLDKIVKVAKELPDYTFILVGSTGPGSEKVIESLKALKERYRVYNVELKPNLPRRELRELMGRAIFYLHPEFSEHFGIAVVEAMSAGLVPIVYRDGGAWYDAVSKISDMLGYNDIEEAPRIIKTLEDNMDLYIRLREKAVEISKLFNYGNFKKNLLEKVNYVLKIKKLLQG